MTDKKLIIYYDIITPPLWGVVEEPDITKYVRAEKCCDDINNVLGWMIDIKPRPIDDPKMMLYSFSEWGPSDLGKVSFCPYCGARIELRRVER